LQSRGDKSRSDDWVVCGLFGVVVSIGARPSIDLIDVEAGRDLLAHRGPDAAGICDLAHCVLAHRRLAVLDPGEGGAQPMRGPSGSTLIYNGELYNDADVRAQLARLGHVFTSHSDTETVVHALEEWGTEALSRFRGMFSLAWLTPDRRTLVLARDPLGIKPLYYASVAGGVGERHIRGQELLFASEAGPIAAAISRSTRHSLRPDFVTVSSYLTTIRTTLGRRTLFDGICAVEPGEVITYDLSTPDLPPVRSSVRPGRRREASRASECREIIARSVGLHLRSDRRVCCLLSGGLDSSIIVSVAASQANEALHTYCAGAVSQTEAGDHQFAAEMAAACGASHTAVGITQELFSSRWPDMIRRLGMPLSTPNEVAINEVGRVLRSRGDVVALSGEGADELFGGYVGPMCSAAAFVARGADPSLPHPGIFQLDDAAWVPAAAKSAVLSEDIWRAVEHDDALKAWYCDRFDAVSAERSDKGSLDAHLRFMRSVNLTGLLGRLDTALMLEGVEGRTPFADIEVAEYAEALSMDSKFRASPTSVGVWESKRCLREAFAGELPESIVGRPKASFPLPFQSWMGEQAQVLSTSSWARDVFSQAALSMVSSGPAELWRLAWPMVNLTMWADHWWPT